MRVFIDASEEGFTIREHKGPSARPLPCCCFVVPTHGITVVGSNQLENWAVLLSQGEAVLELAEGASALVIESEKRPEETAQQVASVGKPVHCARKLCYELSHMDGFSTKIVWSLCNEIFCHMERALASYSKRNPSLKLISEIVDAKLPGHIRLEATASAVGLRPRELSALIRRECGCAFREYVVRKRLDQACYRMMHTRQALGEIALQCGFADQAHFTREFKKIVGLTPARYAKANCE